MKAGEANICQSNQRNKLFFLSKLGDKEKQRENRYVDNEG